MNPMPTKMNAPFLPDDVFALEPLCWAVDAGGTLRTAARADVLTNADTPLDPQALFDYLYFHCIPAPNTVFSGVSRLPAAHRLVPQTGGARVEPAWAPRFTPARGPVSFNALRDEFRAHLKASVERALGAGPVACFLSGGTDSSTVAGMVREVTGQGAEAFSIGFEAEGYDEMDYARQRATSGRGTTSTT